MLVPDAENGRVVDSYTITSDCLSRDMVCTMLSDHAHDQHSVKRPLGHQINGAPEAKHCTSSSGLKHRAHTCNIIEHRVKAMDSRHSEESSDAKQTDINTCDVKLTTAPLSTKETTDSLNPEQNITGHSLEQDGAAPSDFEQNTTGSVCADHSSECSDPVSCPSHDGHSGQPSATQRIDSALQTLKSELMAMREQDLELLKQLIHINDTIRRLKRTRWLKTAGRTVSCGVLGLSSSSSLPQGTLARGGRDPGAVLSRQRSAPGLVGPRRMSTLTSTSSFDTINDADETDSLYGSNTELDMPMTPEMTSPTGSASSYFEPRTSPTSYASLTFTQEEIWKGESSYGEILKRNVRLWKWSVAREKESGSVEGHPCVL